MGLILRLGKILGVLRVVKGVHRLALLSRLLLHLGRVGLMGSRLKGWSRGVPLPLLPRC